MDIGKVVNVLNNLIKRDIESCNPSDEVTGMQGVILHFILNRNLNCNADVYSKDIEEEFCMRRATVSGYLALLEQNGMIIRIDVMQDKRLKKIVLTDKAKGLLVGIDENIARNESKLARGLSEDEIDCFLKIAKKMSDNLKD